MGRVGACSLSGCRMAAMRRLLGLPVACYSQGCPSHAPDYDRATKMCYYHYGEGCDIGGPGSCCSNSDCRGRGEHVCEVRQGERVCEQRQGGVGCEEGKTIANIDRGESCAKRELWKTFATRSRPHRVVREATAANALTSLPDQGARKRGAE